ncbi:MAG: FtsX-like permease family protein [Gemmatimonadetes bacterium]|nr:FtsX-like permease family protein [Gemmatimonadota bacterium]
MTSYAFYVPARQVREQVGALLVRVQGDPTGVLAAVRPRVWSVDPNVPVTRITSFDELLSSAVSEQRYRARLMVTFAGLAALFALLGVYGVTARFVARRTREMGIRAALGADRGQVVSLVLGKGIRLAFLGAAVGLAASLVSVRLLDELLFGVSATDPASLIVIGLTVAASSVAASLSPAWRAARVQPVEALRTE